MNDLEKTAWTRRKFMSSVSGLLVTAGVMADPVLPLGNQDIPELPGELTAEEKEYVAKSSMAKDISNYFGEGYSCAESLFMVSLRYLKKPEELVWISSGFGGQEVPIIIERVCNGTAGAGNQSEIAQIYEVCIVGQRPAPVRDNHIGSYVVINAIAVA